MTKDEFRQLLRLACEDFGNAAAWAKAKSVSVTYVYDVLNGRRDPGPTILEAMGYEMNETTYRKIGGTT